jgi:hypothetical protein
MWGDARLREELDYCVPLGIPHSQFLAWDTVDQDKAIAWRREQAKVCRGCGTRKEEWASDKFAYVGHIEECRGCALLAQEQEHLRDAEERGQRGLKAFLVPRELADDVESVELA